jgi:hypothetical protein
MAGLPLCRPAFLQHAVAHKTNLMALVTGLVIELSERHAKTRSNR